MMIFSLDKMRAPDLRKLPRERTIFFLPVGPIEDHGDALPMSLDLHEAKVLAEKTASRMVEKGWFCVIAPIAALGVDANTSALGIRVRPHILRDYLVDFSNSLATQGFRYFCVITGNAGPRQLTVIEEAGKFLRKRHLRFGIFPNARAPMLVSGNSVLIDDAEKSNSSLFMAPKEHGGARDAGVALATVPELVDEKLLRTLSAVEPRGGLFHRLREGRAGKISGYWGNPAAGSAEAGTALLDEKSATLAIKLQAAIEGGKPHALFKSWYSLVPSNQSLFRVWILVFFLTVMLATWTFLSLQSFMVGTELN
jgi:creatinine amidohydrolase/Fe(II)-dependent formamide hydrolase-like protein